MATVLGLLSSLLWGTADFMGGQLTRRYPVFFVVGVSQAAGLILMIIVATATGSWDTPQGYVPWAVVASISGFLGLAVFYLAMATGAVGVVSPITALGGLGPLLLGLLTGEEPSVLQYAGLAVALTGVVLASGPEITGDTSARPVVLAILATILFGVCMAAIAVGSRTSAVMTMTGMRMTTVLVLSMVGAVALIRGWRPPRPTIRHAGGFVALGWFDVGANLLFGLATTVGMVSLVAVLGSVYPVVTVLLAWWLLHERLKPVQYVGVACTLGGVAAIMA